MAGQEQFSCLPNLQHDLKYTSGLFRLALNYIWDDGTVKEQNRTSWPCLMQSSLTDLSLNLVDLPATGTLVRRRDGVRVLDPAIHPPGAL